MSNENLIRDVVLLTYKAFGGAIRGKTLLQKRVYFLSIFLRSDLGYEAHYYGPYSEGVATVNAELKSLGFLSESATGWGVDRRGFEMARYDFTLTDAGIRISDKKAELHPQLWEQVQQAAKVITDAGNLDYMELSIAAKAYYVLMHMKRRATLDDISEMLPKFGWSVKKEELTNATKFLEKTGLVKQA